MVRRLALILAVALPVFANEGLVKLAEVWSTVKYLHPQTLQREIDLDGMLVRAIPNVRAAKTDAEVAKAIGDMLAELNDPATRVTESAKKDGPAVPIFRREGETVVVNLGPYGDSINSESLFDEIATMSKEIATAKAVVIDMRSKSGEQTAWILSYINGLVKESVPPLPVRGVFHSGYAPQSGSTSGGYYSAIQTQLLGAFAVRPQTAAPASRRVVFVVNGDTVALPIAAMWWNGDAAVVSEKALTDAAVATIDTIELSKTHTARVRIGELAASGFTADAVVARGNDDATMKKAMEIATASTPFAQRPPASSSGFTTRRVVEKPYPDMHYPDLPHRLLALFRLWTIIDTFYRYKHLIGDWDAVLTEFIPRFENAKDEHEYAAAVLEVVARIEDGHSGAYGHRAAPQVTGGMWQLPVELRYVEGQVVVIGKRGNFAEGTPLHVGDVVVSIDGEAVDARVQRLWKYRTASTEIARKNRLLNTAGAGAMNSIATLVVRGADGSTRTVDVPRVGQYVPPPEPKDLPYRVMDGNIGYVDLTRLTTMQVDPMFDALKGTKAIVFDMRGYPKGTAWSIAPRINTNKAVYGASFRRAQLPRYAESGGYYFDQELPKTDKWIYTGKTVMLIDDRAISQSEHSGLFYEMANGTKFIGSNSAGANGDVTNFTLPGGFTVGFTGHDVRHADGRQLQRIGLVPDVRVEPTIKGIREGKDEVLARAIAFINTGK
jgi:C-terminal processing protease CtpA/Prc